MSLLMDKTLREFNTILASKEPAPGGGSTAALSGLLGASLTLMVVNLSVGKKAYEALEEHIKQAIEVDFRTISHLYTELTELVDEDTKAFNLFMEAMKLPKESDDQKAAREASIQKASMYALEIPLLVAEKCLLLLRHQVRIAGHGNKNAVSDIGVGALLAFTGLEGAILNVKINLPNIIDQSIKIDSAESIERYLLEGIQLKTEIIEIVNKRILGI
jgi:methenyltetrahydrofolate cyclohydrolase